MLRMSWAVARVQPAICTGDALRARMVAVAVAVAVAVVLPVCMGVMKAMLDAVDDGTRAQEEQRFEEGMGEKMEKAGDVGAGLSQGRYHVA
jgi:hypothetical protein